MKKLFLSACIASLAMATVPAFAQTISTVAGNGSSTYAGDGGQATAAGFERPEDVAPIPGGGYYISASAQVRRVASDGTISAVAGNGASGFSGDGGLATSAQLSSQVTSVFLASDGSLYLSDHSNKRIRKIDSAGVISTIAGNGSTTPVDGGQATSSGLNLPTDALLGPDGGLYIVEFAGCRVRKVDTTGVITTVAGTGTCTAGGDGGQANATPLYHPWGARFGSDGALYVSEYAANRVRRIAPDGAISTVAGSTGISGPLHIDFDAADNLYISAFGGQTVHRVTPGGVASVVAGTGNGGFSGDGGAATAARLAEPRSVTVASGRLYIADSSNNRIREVLADVEPLGSTDEPATTCASEGYTSTQLTWCQKICESGLTGKALEDWIHRWTRRYRDLPYCAAQAPEPPPQEG